MIEQDEYTIPFGRNNYCGPCALAYLLRTDPDTAAAKLRAVSGLKAIRGIHHWHILKALEDHGNVCLPVAAYQSRGRGSVKHGRLVDWASKQPQGAEYLIVTSNHYVVVHRGMVFDSFKHLGIPVAKSKWARTFVRSAWWIAR